MKFKKLNNKGLSVVELVIAFAILMVIVIGMLDLIINLKDITSKQVLENKIVEFQGTLTQVIQDDLIKKKATNVKACSGNSNRKMPCYKITFKNGSTKNLVIKLNERVITYDGINYVLPEKEIMEFRDSAVWANNTDIEKAKNNIRVLKDSNNFINIYIPFYIIDEEKNIGIDIVYPIGL